MPTRMRPFLARGQLRQSARHRAVPAVGSQRPVRRRPRRCARGAAATDRRRGPDAPSRVHSAAYPRRLSDGLRAAADRRLRSAGRTSTAGSTTGCTPRSTARSTPFAGRDRRRLGRRGARAHRRSRGAARRPRRAAPEVVQPLRRGDPRPVRDRPRRPRPTTAQRDRVGTPTSHVDIVPTLLSAAGIDSQPCREELTRRVQRAASAAGPRPDAGRRRHGRRAGRPRRLPDDARQHPRGRHRRLAGRPRCSASAPHPRQHAHLRSGRHRRQLRGDRGRRRGALSGSWCARSTTRRRGPSRAFATSRRRAPTAIATASDRSPTNGSCTT